MATDGLPEERPGVVCRAMVTHNQNIELTIRPQRATALDDHSNDATAYLPGVFLRMLPGASEILPFGFESGTTGGGGGRLGLEATELSRQLEFAIAGDWRFLVRFQRVAIQ